MTKQELIASLSKSSGVNATDTGKIIEAFMKELPKKLLAENDSLFLRGFGTFSLKMYKDRIARNISKGTPVTVPARRKLTFKQSNQLDTLFGNN